jgi:NAD(P)-dependent dehydrogenase (short-subunit alcohol dehydrogenase family)
MTEPLGPLLVTGASGTVGAALLCALAPTWRGDLLALGRTRPQQDGHRSIRFTAVDLADPDAVDALSAHLAAGPPVGALVCAAGLDARARLSDFTPRAAAACMQVNAWAHLQLLNAALASRTNIASTTLPVVLISSDVVGSAMPGTLVYAAAKTAAEEAFRHAMADAPPPGFALLIVRLPYIGVPMRAAVPGPPPPPHTGNSPRPVLAAAAAAITSFLTIRQHTTVEVWHA